MILQIKQANWYTLSDFLTKFGLIEEFETFSGGLLEEWIESPDMEDIDVIDILLSKYRPENNYVLHSEIEDDSTLIIEL